MSKKKKIIIISVISVIVLAIIIATVIFLINRNNSKENQTYVGDTKIARLYDRLSKEKMFSFTTTIDDNNKEIYAKTSDAAYIDTTYEGEESKFVIKDGNSYLLNDENKIYYTYQNNEIDLNRVIEQLEEVKDTELVEGTENIEGKEYNYEEYSGFTSFAFKLSDEGNTDNMKTRFYFDGDNLVYIKTITSNTQELLKVEISDDVDENLFEIPSDYREM